MTAKMLYLEHGFAQSWGICTRLLRANLWLSFCLRILCYLFEGCRSINADHCTHYIIPHHPQNIWQNRPWNALDDFDTSWLPTQEDIVSKVFERYGLRLDVVLSSGQVGSEPKHPYIKLESWIQALDKRGKLWKFMGMGPEFNKLKTCKPCLLDFWKKYELNHGKHQVFELARKGEIPLDCSVPILIHGDEGTTYKKDGCLVLSVHSILGTLSNKLGPVSEGDLPPHHTNFVGNAFQTRFLLGSLLKDPWLYDYIAICFLSLSDYARLIEFMLGSVSGDPGFPICFRMTIEMTTQPTLTCWSLSSSLWTKPLVRVLVCSRVGACIQYPLETKVTGLTWLLVAIIS